MGGWIVCAENYHISSLMTVVWNLGEECNQYSLKTVTAMVKEDLSQKARLCRRAAGICRLHALSVSCPLLVMSK